MSRWGSLVLIVALLLLTLSLNGCQSGSAVPVASTPAQVAAISTAGTARLSVDVVPAGTAVAVDAPPGSTVAASPTVKPPAGSAEPPTPTRTLVPTATAVPPLATMASTPSVRAPAGPGAGPTVVTLPTQLPPTPTSAPTAATQFRVEQIEIPTYPYAQFLSAATDPAVSDYPLLALDRGAYDGSNPQPALVTYDLLVLENRYLRLSILPDLGGRIYECVFKPTGNDEFYRNPVIKPTHWGPAGSEHPAGANWWLAAGGLEWGFPVEEHGYEWATKWEYKAKTLTDGGVTVSLTTGDQGRPFAVVTVTLPPDSATFTVQPRIVDAGDAPFRFKWWDNAMLAPGAANAPGPDLCFILPGSEVTVHSTGDESLPDPGQGMSWPLYDGRDLSRLGNWKQWLGAFARPSAQGNYVGVYDTAADEGMIRLATGDGARGVKIFAMGWESPIDWHNWTDDGSGYVELHGGLMPTFDDWAELGTGEQITWTETWFPVAGIGHVSYADDGGAVNLRRDGSHVVVGLFPNEPVRGRLEITVAGLDPIGRQVDLAPDRPFYEEISLDGADVPAWGDVSVSLFDESNQVILAYETWLQLQPPR